MPLMRKAVAPFLAFVLILALLSGCTGKPGATGAGVTGASVNSSGHLILSLSSGTTLDAGYVVGPDGGTGATGPAGATGARGPAGPAGSGGSGGTLSSVSSLVSKITPSIVFIEASNRFGIDSGTGVIISSSRGYILTAYHVTAGASSINITFSSGVTTAATFVAGTAGRDYAVLKLNNVPSGLQAVTLGSSSASAVGDYVVSGGFALGYTPNPSFTFGIISAFRHLGDGFNYVQTDAAINAGDSGGPLLNMNGQVIGINDQADVYDNEGNPVMNMAYCLPMDELLPVIQSYVN